VANLPAGRQTLRESFFPELYPPINFILKTAVMNFVKPILLATTCLLVFASCNNDEKKTDTGETTSRKLKEEKVTYTGDNVTMNGYVVYDGSGEGPRPAVLVVHEWWGQNDYSRSRARQLADLGYIAMAVDMYGDGKQADSPDSAQKLAMPFYMDPQMAKRRFDAAYDKLKSFPQTDSNNIAAIGYCFGGAQVLNMAKMGSNLAGVVSFHGNLTVVPANKDLLKAQVLVCHGGNDSFVPQAEVDKFKKEMDSIGANYTLKVYPGATHAFTNPGADEKARKYNMPIAYNAAADSASWKDMKDFFNTIFK
jgi:dienelactone hydrolase